MTRQSFPLSAQERQLVLGLLESEQRELQPELHHTDSPGMRDEIHARMTDVARLIRRLRRPATKPRSRRTRSGSRGTAADAVGFNARPRPSRRLRSYAEAPP